MHKKHLLTILSLLVSACLSNAALLIHYSFDSESIGALSNGAVVSNTGTSGTNGTAGVPGGSITVSNDANRVDGPGGLLGNYLNIQPGADGNEGISATHITSGSTLSALGIDGATDYSMMAWVKFDNSTGDNMVFGGASGDVLHNGARGATYHGGHWGDDISGGSNDPGNWHHVTWTNSGTTQEIFVDGVVAVSGGTGSSGAFSNNLSQNLLIATSRNGGSFRGSLDDVGVFSTKLNTFQVAAFHSLGLNADYGYNASEVDQMISAHLAGPGSSVTLTATTWEYVNSDPLDGRDFVQLDSGGSGMAGSTGPPIRLFAVDHVLIPEGESVVLSWDVGTDATTLTIDQGIGNVLPMTTDGIGQTTVNPLANTTYTLTASNAAGTNTSMVTVTVTNQPIIEFFTADQTIVAPDTPVQLDWGVLSVDSLDLNGSDVTGSSSLVVMPSATTTWTLTANNSNGTISAQVTVTVVIPGEPVISEISADNQGTLVDEDGESKDWIELHNPSGSTAILNDYYLSDDPGDLTKWRLPNMTLPAGDYLLIFASGKNRAVAGAELHTNFSLRSGGEYLALSKLVEAQTTILSVFDPYPNQFEDITWGLFPDGITLGYFTSPTPGSANVTGLFDYVRDTSFLPKRGLYSSPIAVTISSNTLDAQFRYTTDGSAPTTGSGTLYTGPINISSTTNLRVIGFKADYLPTNIDTHTYLFLDDVIQQSPTGAQPTPDWPSGSVNGQIYDYGMDPAIVTGNEQAVKDALAAIPSISISMKQSDFSGGSGIFSNPGSRGIAWERACSVELLNDINGGFQVEAGIRVRGGFSRSTGNPKHALRLFFRKEYGDTKLRYPMFEDEGADEFDNLDFRTSQNYSWAFQNSGNNTFMREVFGRDTQRDMGQPHTRSRYYHIYINGVYWGLYMSQERAEASYGETYFGGDKTEYDTVKSSGSPGGYTMEVTDGNLTDWTDLWNQAIAHSNSPTIANYNQMQGRNPDGTRNLAYPILLDTDNLIDYMLDVFYTYSTDAPLTGGGDRTNNWFGVRNRATDTEGFAYFAHDMEHSQGSNGGVSSDRTGPFNNANATNFSYSNPQFIYQLLTGNPEFRMDFADRTQRHFFNGGALTPDACFARYNARAVTIDTAVLAESARWGDSKRAAPFLKSDWENARNYLLNTWAPQRSPIVLNQLRSDNLFPNTDAPTFSQHGGHISSSAELAMSNTSGIVYYTTDGSDPRLPGGTLNPAAQIYDGSTTTTTLVNSGSSWNYLDNGTNQGTAWQASGFNDVAWASGNAELGYGDGGESTVVGWGPSDTAKYITTYFRKTFNATNVANHTGLTLELVRDDGAVVYLNGNELVRPNMPGGTINYLTLAGGTVGAGDESTFFSFAIPPSSLVEGANTLAVEIHQASGTSSDISFDLRLRATQSSSADPLFMTASGPLRARSLDAGEWSAVNEATFIVDAAIASNANLVITEIHYRPLPPTPAEGDAGHNERSNFEFIELMNIGTKDVDMTNVRFTSGISFDFDDSAIGFLLTPGQRVLLVNNLAAFQFRYPSVAAADIAGEYSGNLNNDGEPLALLASDSSVIRDFTYNDKSPWPESADGDGFSLVLIYPSSNPDHADPFSWRPSVSLHGNPAASDAVGFTGNPSEDNDVDDVPALIEYLLGTSDAISSAETLPTASAQNLTVNTIPDDYLAVSFTIDLSADDVAYLVEVSDNLSTWISGSGNVEFVSRTNHGDGTATMVYRSANPISADVRYFVRLKATLR
ncbi:MAG: hypothetical protein ACI9UA_003405 [Pseudoalteromonas tetraodonis]|jgi:hypothetical protein